MNPNSVIVMAVLAATACTVGATPAQPVGKWVTVKESWPAHVRRLGPVSESNLLLSSDHKFSLSGPKCSGTWEEVKGKIVLHETVRSRAFEHAATGKFKVGTVAPPIVLTRIGDDELGLYIPARKFTLRFRRVSP